MRTILLSLLAVTSVWSQDDWLIDEQESIIQKSMEAEQVLSLTGSSSINSAEPMSVRMNPEEFLFVSADHWTAALQFVTLARDDGINLRWSDGAGEHVSTVETGLNSGLRMRISREAPTADPNAGVIGVASFLVVTGTGEVPVITETYISDSSLISASAGLGTTGRILGGRSQRVLGLRYTRVADNFDIRFPAGFLGEDLAAASNDILTIEGTLQGQWDWRRLVFTTSLSGGLGGSRSQQRGLWSDGPSTFFDETSFQFSAVSEVNVEANLKVTDMTSMQLGLQGLLISGVIQARDAWAEPGDPATVRLIGLTFGIERKF